MGLRSWGLPVLLPALPMVLPVHTPTVTCLYLNPSAVVAPMLKIWVSGLRVYMYYHLQLPKVLPVRTPTMTYAYLNPEQPRVSDLS